MAEITPIISRFLEGYRHKETLPTKFNPKEISDIAIAAKLGLQMGMPQIGWDTLASRILVEGRENAGTNGLDPTHKESVALYRKLVAAGVDSDAARYPAVVLEKAQVAKRLGISFDEAWNGTGKNFINGKTGKDYAARMEAHKEAVNDPRNKAFVSFIERAGNLELTPQEKLNIAPTEKLMGILFGAANLFTDQFPFENPKSNLAQAFLDQQKKQSGGPIKVASLLGGEPRQMTYNANIANILMGVIRDNAGLEQRPEEQNAKTWISGSPALQQVFQDMAVTSLKQLGIEPLTNNPGNKQ